ncbi:TLC domain-containing protein 1 [Gadus macrocephalus]|uniref:TLC domain-containing protein 1 n=1 Tax=Gadus macrocephalus TaxID=80720 RepID=UPI0028CB9137|nr:TLC domain-containing protein 1 [Gadus macrocephalus]
MEVLLNHPCAVVLVCALLFRVAHCLLQNLPVPKVVRGEEFRAWKWKNLSVSLVHSLLTGAWALSCVLIYPETVHNLHSYFVPVSYLLVCVSTGYFVQDAGDIILTGHARGSWEFLVHHTLVIWCFGYALFTKLYVSGAVVALFVEVNSVTLHLRLMLKLAEQMSSPAFQVNKMLNLFTYVFFRLSAQGYLTWYIVYNYSWLDHASFFLAAMVLMNGMILVYFYRLLRADFCPRPKRTGTQNGTHKSAPMTQKFLTD